MNRGTPSLCSSSVSHAHFPSTSVCWRSQSTPSALPSFLVWVGDASSHLLSYHLSLSLSLSRSDTHACALPIIFSPMLPPSCFPPSQPPPPLCSQSHLEVYMCIHREMLHVNAHVPGGEGGVMWKTAGRKEGKRGRSYAFVYLGREWVVRVEYSKLLLYST